MATVGVGPTRIRNSRSQNTCGCGLASLVTDAEGQMHELVRRDVEISLRGQPESEMAASSINSVLQRVTGASVQEIETLIAELETLRDMLKDEAARVQREERRRPRLAIAHR